MEEEEEGWGTMIIADEEKMVIESMREVDK